MGALHCRSCRRVTEGLIDHGVSVFLCALEDNPVLAQSHLEALTEKQVDGIVVAGRRVDRILPVDFGGADGSRRSRHERGCV